MAPLRTTPHQKVILVISAAAFVAISCLTAAIPINLPRHQEAKGTTESGTENLNSGDTVWVLVSTILGFFVGPLTAYIYANIYGKDEHLLVNVTLITSTIITVLWIVMTFSLVYGEDANDAGFLGFPVTYYMFRDVGAKPAAHLAPTIPCSIYAVFELGFALLTPTIVASDIIDRTNVFGLVFFLLAWHILVYCPVAHIMWNPRGILFRNTVEDFAGGVVVNVLSSASVVAAHLYLDYVKAPNYAVKIPNNAKSAFLSTLLLWFLWFGLLAGKAHDASPVAAQAVVNTIAAVQVAVLVGYLLDRLYSREMADSSVSMINNILLGVVAVTPVCGFTTVGGAMFVSIVTVALTKAAGRYLLNDGVVPHDPLNVTTIHGVGGTTAFLMAGISSYAFVNPSASNGLTAGHQTPIRMHVAAALALWPCLVLTVLVLMLACDHLVPISAYATTKRVMLPVFSHAVPRDASEEAPGALDATTSRNYNNTNNTNTTSRVSRGPVSEEDKFNLAREASLYRKLSTYFAHSQKFEE